MRVLFVVTPGIGHLFPTVPLAWALRITGHEVLVATTGAAARAAAEAGLPVADVFPGRDFAALMSERFRSDPELVKLITRENTDLAAVVPMLADMSTRLTDGTTSTVEQWRPGVIVQSATEAAAFAAAGRFGIPLVRHGFGFLRAAGMGKLIVSHMTEVMRRLDVTAVPEYQAAIDVAPPSLVPAVEGWSMRYVPYNRGAVLTDDLVRTGPATGRPRVAVTLGTVATGLTGLGPVARLLSVADQVDAEFVVALGDADTSGLGPVPDNVRLAGWIPLDALLRTSTALVHHGGAGTTLGALVAGVPQLVLPSGSDRYLNAAAVRDGGAGLSAAEGDLDAELLTRLSEDGDLRRRAQEVRAEIAALPSPVEIAERVIDLVR
ncbi:nucleotide disphospho-sugar-binding domain-containing protein [Amycolatopsis sacchari]|uniref:nucleotide disphospho-sugar-binding domain-containing protein n=1 Tax=Amycolatopsis sacchari TaxID=115433 RepID=UPI003D737DE0